MLIVFVKSILLYPPHVRLSSVSPKQTKLHVAPEVSNGFVIELPQEQR